MMLRFGLGHELPYAFVKSAISYQIGTGTPRLADPLVFEWRPFSENCGSIKIDLNVSQRLAFFFPAALRPADDFVFFAPGFFAAFFDAFVAVLAVFFYVDFFADFLGAAAFTAVVFGNARFLSGAANSGAGTAAASVASGM
jgi:hypothetical protein